MASHVHVLGPFCSCFCDGLLPIAKRGEWRSWLREHGVPRVAGAGPIQTTDTAVSGEKMVSFSVEQGTVDTRVARRAALQDFRRNLSCLWDFEETSLLELLLAAPCLVQRVWILGPVLEWALLGSPDYSWLLLDRSTTSGKA